METFCIPVAKIGNGVGAEIDALENYDDSLVLEGEGQDKNDDTTKNVIGARICGGYGEIMKLMESKFENVMKVMDGGEDNRTTNNKAPTNDSLIAIDSFDGALHVNSKKEKAYSNVISFSSLLYSYS